MQAIKSIKSRTSLSSTTNSSLSSVGNSKRTTLRFYNTPPSLEITLEQFETYALDRLTLLKRLEQLKVLGQLNNSSLEINELLKLYQFDAAYKGIDKDNISHYILRLAFCSTEELRRWLQIHETMLFQYRFEDGTRSANEIDSFFKSNDIEFEELSNEDFEYYRKDLTDMHLKEMRDETTFYKIPFEQALSLIKNRSVLLIGGYAYVPKSSLVSIVVAKFRAHLGAALAITFQNSRTIRDQRLLPIVNNLSKQSAGIEAKYDSIQGQITPDQLPKLAKRSFPLCMDNLYSHLTEEGHLRFGGRMQLGLFIKALGITMEDALEFWRNSFSKKITADKFQKEYAYNIRHMYGKEGKRTSYTPYSCVHIIMNGSSGATEHHGCPFKHFSESGLRSKLVSKNVQSNGIEEIIKLVHGQHFQIACQKYYALTHGGVDNPKVVHPNAFVAESIKYYKDEIALPTTSFGASQSQSQAPTADASQMDVDN